MISSITLGLTALSVLGNVAAYTVDPPSAASPDTIEDCTYWQVATATDTCESISEYWGLTVEQFTTYNPSLSSVCNLIVENSYCIESNYGIPAAPTTTVVPTPTPTATPAPAPTTPQEICEAEAGGYKEYCSRCLKNCADRPQYYAECFNSVFSTMNYYDSQCWQHGGNDCKNKAADQVCPRT